MRTAAICPTCATYTNAVCVIYDGPYLATLDIAPLTNLEEIIEKINTKFGTIPASLGYTPENVANKSTSTSLGTSDTFYPTQNAVKTYVDTAISAIPSPSIPTLQQVLTAGNLSSTGIVLSDGIVNDVALDPFNVVVIDQGTGEYVQLLKNEIIFSNGNDPINIINPFQTAPRTINLPDGSGTFVLSVNGVTPSTAGNVTLPLTPYKKYVAKITQFGSNAPIVDIVLENDFTNPVTYSYVNVGQYSLNCLDIGNDLDKVVVFFQQATGSLGVTISTPVATNSVGIFTWDTTSNVLTNGTFTKAVIEVRIYP